jgi:uncharacterized membrane protein
MRQSRNPAEMFTPAEAKPFLYVTVPNRSLGPRGRVLCVGAIGVTTMGVAAAAFALGAWPVAPFAGLEVALVAFAFHRIGLHDGDYERLEIAGTKVSVESRDAARVTRFEGHAPWARLVVAGGPARCELRLRYAGRGIAIGRLLPEQARRELAAELGRRLPVEAIQG